jgi:hypothetical protein
MGTSGTPPGTPLLQRLLVQKCPNFSSAAATSTTGPKPTSVYVMPRRGQPMRQYTLQAIKATMHLRQVDAAKRLKINVSCLKKICKDFGIKKWPRLVPEELVKSAV